MLCAASQRHTGCRHTRYRPTGGRLHGRHAKAIGFDALGAATAIAGGLAARSLRYHDRVSFERITTDPGRMGGLPCIRGLRFPVATVVAMVADGMTFQEILAEHPDLEEEDIREALRYASQAVEERELPLRTSA